MDTDDHILDLLGLLIVLGLIAGVGILVLFGGQTGPGAPSPEPPDANWSVQRVNATHVQIGHVGGESVGADTIVITVDGTERATPWTGTVERGDVGTVRAMEDARLTLFWAGSPRTDRISLGNWTV